MCDIKRGIRYVPSGLRSSSVFVILGPAFLVINSWESFVFLSVEFVVMH